MDQSHSENTLIHCTKPEGIAASVTGVIAEATAQLNSSTVEHEPDPEDDLFADLDL